MSEWNDGLKQSISSISQLLQEQIEKVNPRRILRAEETKRLCKEFGLTAGILKGALAKGRKKQ